MSEELLGDPPTHYNNPLLLGSPEILVPVEPEHTNQMPHRDWCQLNLFLDQATCEQDSTLQMLSEATTGKSNFCWCDTIHICLPSHQRKSHVSESPRGNMLLPWNQIMTGSTCFTHAYWFCLWNVLILLRHRWNNLDEFPDGRSASFHFSNS